MFHRAQIVDMIYHTDGKRCAVCLTSHEEAVGRGTNDFTRIGTFEIISRHCYLFI